MPDISERSLEETIEATLLGEGPRATAGEAALREVAAPYGVALPGGYRRRNPTDFDRALCLIPEDVLGFLYATQPQEWERFKKAHGAEARQTLLRRLAGEVHKRGTLDVLRKGLKCDGSQFRLAYFRPSSGLNEALQRVYEGNLFAVVRQLHYSQANDNSLDLALFLNGLPIFSAELKNPLTGQSVTDAVRQYRTDRDPKEALFQFRRCLAHFALDPESVYVTTHLLRAKTRFLPFNHGRDGGAGNPPSARGYATAYLWEQIWSRDSVLNLIQQFIYEIEEEDDKGRKTGESSLIFPRYHQLDAVRRLLQAARESGPGQRYLIQHSAGSGKSYSIAWLAHQLSVLHDAQDRRVFDSIIVVTDRRVLDRALQQHVRQFEQVLGVVENIDKTSRQLKEALEAGKTIIVTTLQKFPVIVKDMHELSNQRFAVIIDEAHSSQGGESTKDLKTVLAAGSLEDAERAESQPRDDVDERALAVIRTRGQLPNVSYFAFTATPKATTLQLFGMQRADGTYAPFSLYTMRQAIEEGFILDVLQNYTTYRSYWNLLKRIRDDPHYERQKASAVLRSFVELHEHAIDAKLTIMLDHFVERVMGRINGRAKAMIVTRSRRHAIRYKLALDRLLRERGLPFKALVALSGMVEDNGARYTEAGMNGFPETHTAEEFKKDEHRILVVAYKFQTGFDQPLLHTMYVDQRLNGVQAVQTLSRLNRTAPDKEECLVLDFANDAEAIREAFQPYYDRAILSEGTDPNLLYDLETRLVGAGLYEPRDLERFAQAYFDPKASQARLYTALQPVLDRFQEAPQEDQTEFRDALLQYVQLYAFLSQILPFADAGLEKLYVFGKLLLRRIKAPKGQLPLQVQQQIDIESYRVQKTRSGRMTLERGQAELPPVGAAPVGQPLPDEMQPLSAIILELNQRFGTNLTDKDKASLEQLEARLRGDAGLAASVRVNTRDNARLTFDHVAGDRLEDLVDSNFKLYRDVTDNPDFAKLLFDWLFERYLRRTKGEQGGAEG
jgi:type I restriction enzyme R subunit